MVWGLGIEQHRPSSLLRCSCVRTAVCLRPAPSLCKRRSGANADRKTENFFKKRVSLWKKDAGASFSGKAVHTYTEGDAGYTMTNIL